MSHKFFMKASSGLQESRRKEDRPGSVSASLKRITQRGLYLFAAAMVSVFTLSMSTVSAAQNDVKTVPAAPTTDSQGVTAPNKEKDSKSTDQKTQALAYTASLSASSTNLWPLQYSTLTASTNQDKDLW